MFLCEKEFQLGHVRLFAFLLDYALILMQNFAAPAMMIIND